MAALLPTERGVLLTTTGTCSSLGPRTSGTAGEVRVTWSVGSEVWRRDVSESCKKKLDLRDELTFHELVVEFASALRAMTFRVVLAWVAIWMHGGSY
jgi:hypothetical protein